MTHNVYSIRTRKLLSETENGDVKTPAQEEIEIGQALMTQNAEATKQELEGVIRLVEQGRVEGLMLIAKDAHTGLFYTTSTLREPFVQREDLFGYIGVLDTMKLELSDQAAMAPTITLSGDVLDPYEDPDETDDYEDDYE